MTDPTFVALATVTIATGVNWIKYIRSRDWNGTLTTLVAWVTGWLFTFTAAHSGALFGQLPIHDVPLEDLPGAALVLLGIAVASGASQLRELQKAFDRTDTAAKPELLTGNDAQKVI